MNELFNKVVGNKINIQISVVGSEGVVQWWTISLAYVRPWVQSSNEQSKSETKRTVSLIITP
jgi:hypothetical protein